MKLTYWGHSCFYLETGKYRLVIDPFLTGNPKAPVKATDVQCDYVLVSHAHSDHMGDALSLAKSNNATVISTFEVGTYLARQGATAHTMGIGGAFQFPFGKVKLTIAHHGSSAETEDGLVNLGPPAGILITVEGKTIYHAGDTGLFLDMQLIGESAAIDVALLPIGDNYTMGIEDAVRAIGMLRPKIAIPMHYGTFGLIDVDPHQFVEQARSQENCRVELLQPGESLEL